MQISEVVFENFRIYYGANSVHISTTDDQNIVVISGKNGFGKTTFLMGLVWCLFGKQMEKVDQIYKKEINEKGGYSRYIANSLNKKYAGEGGKEFSVSITFSGVKIPEITCSQIKVTRSYNTVVSTGDKIEILVDGMKNQLIDDLSKDNQSGEEIFIRDFILPLEIAKFFFFDAEKIVALAEVNSPEEKRDLSIAYSEVLGIKKYEDLRINLESLREDYKKGSAKPEERKEWNNIEGEIKTVEDEISALENKKEEQKEKKEEKNYDSNEIQTKLIREGNKMSLDELALIKSERDELELQMINLQDELKGIFDFLPFGIAGDLIVTIVEQVKLESEVKKSKFLQEDVDQKVGTILKDFEKDRFENGIMLDWETRKYVEDQFAKLIKRHFFGTVPNLPENFQAIHDLSASEEMELDGLMTNLQHSFKEKFLRINREFQDKKYQIDQIKRKIRDAEKDAEDVYIQSLRKRKDQLDNHILEIETEIEITSELIGIKKIELKTLRQRKEELSKKIAVSKEKEAMDTETARLISELKQFVIKFKEEKKKSLEVKIREGLNTLLHKKGFVKKVIVDISASGEDVDISLFDKNDVKIEKSSLSMGERQMYASALLKALVEESDIEFPVFIDSPMQKFDEAHAQNIIKYFYPDVSEQVVIFPLLNKELTEKEYGLLKSKISTAYLIENINTEQSMFTKVAPAELISKYNEIYNAN